MLAAPLYTLILGATGAHTSVLKWESICIKGIAQKIYTKQWSSTTHSFILYPSKYNFFYFFFFKNIRFCSVFWVVKLLKKRWGTLLIIKTKISLKIHLFLRLLSPKGDEKNHFRCKKLINFFKHYFNFFNISIP